MIFYSCIYARTYEIQFFSAKLPDQVNFTRLKDLGIDKIIFPVFEDNETDGGLYFVNTRFRTLEPKLEQIIQGFDYKAFDLCAWMLTRKFGWIDDPLLLDTRYENGTSQVIRKLDLFNPNVLQKLTTVYRELASRKIDAILIQDDMIIRHNEGFSNWGKAHFSNVTGVPAKEYLMMQKNTPYNRSWNRVKIHRLNNVLKTLVQNCKMVNTAVKVGINVYYETPLYVERAEAWYGHNLREILETGVDYIYLMTYHRQIKEEMGLSESRSRMLFKEIVESAYQICKEKLIVKVQLRDWATGERIPVEEARAYFDLIPSQVERVCLVPVTVDDFDFLKELLEPRSYAKGREGEK